MGVHRLGAVEVLVGEAHVVERLPGPVERLDVAAACPVGGMLFDQPVEADGKLEAVAAAGGAGVLGQGVDAESLGIGLLAVGERLSPVGAMIVGRYRPAAVAISRP